MERTTGPEPLANRRSSLIGLVLGNLVPLGGVVLLDWSVFDILVIYWVETGVIFCCGALKLIQEQGLTVVTRLGLALGVTTIFMGGHYLFLYMVGIFMHEIHSSGGELTLLEPFTQRSAIWFAVAATVVSRVHSTGIVPRRPNPKLPDADALLANVAPRIMVQAAGILGGFAMGVTDSERFVVAIVALVAIKTLLDVTQQRQRTAKPATVGSSRGETAPAGVTPGDSRGANATAKDSPAGS